jgi:hypothetical protein
LEILEASGWRKIAEEAETKDGMKVKGGCRKEWRRE